MRTDIKSVPSNLTNSRYRLVTSPEEIAKIGEVFYGITFNEGDIIEFPKVEDMQYWIDDKRGTRPIAYTNVYINDKLVGIPIGTLRKVPCDNYMYAFLDKYEFNKEIYLQDNDLTRTKLLAGTKIKVEAIVQDHGPVFNKHNDGSWTRAIDENDNKKTEQMRFYVFKKVA